MRYEIIPEQYKLVTVCNDIPNNAYVYCNSRSSNQIAIIRKVQGQYIQLDMSNKVTTANTKFNLLFQKNPNDEIYMIDQTTKTNTCNVQAYKLDINNCTLNLSMVSTYSMRITNPILFIQNQVDYETYGYLNAIENRISNAFQTILNETILDGYELITNGIKINEMINKIKFEINHSCNFYGMSITINNINIKALNFNDISDFYNRDMNFARETKERIINRLIDTVFDQYANTEPISTNQTRILETYLNNAIIENNTFNIEEITDKFSKMSKTFTFKDLIENLDQVNKRLTNIHYLEDK